MMKNTLIIVILNCLMSSFLFSQSIEIDYMVIENRSNYITTNHAKSRLLIQNFTSLFYTLNPDATQYVAAKDPEEYISSKGNKMVRIDQFVLDRIKDEKIFKDYINEDLLYTDNILGKDVNIKESIDIMQWTIIPNKDSVILNYSCQKAITEFRGRTYEAYFSAEINSFGGPWKFDGLPGLILSVRSIDDYFVIHPIKLQSRKDSTPISNPYKAENVFLSWEEFKKLYEKKLKEMLKKMKAGSDSGDSGKITIMDKIESLDIKELSY